MVSSKLLNIIVLFFVEIMGMYFVFFVLLMRMNMFVNYRVIIIEVFGEL